LTTIKEETGSPAAEEMVRQLVIGHEAVVRTSRNAFTTAEAAEDQVTMDLLAERMQVHEKQAWMLRSLLQ
jgi:starvation-inducible DNA-binding protein